MAWHSRTITGKAWWQFLKATWKHRPNTVLRPFIKSRRSKNNILRTLSFILRTIFQTLIRILRKWWSSLNNLYFGIREKWVKIPTQSVCLSLELQTKDVILQTISLKQIKQHLNPQCHLKLWNALTIHQAFKWEECLISLALHLLILSIREWEIEFIQSYLLWLRNHQLFHRGQLLTNSI